jgi:hypothetical protein
MNPPDGSPLFNSLRSTRPANSNNRGEISDIFGYPRYAPAAPLPNMLQLAGSGCAAEKCKATSIRAAAQWWAHRTECVIEACVCRPARRQRGVDDEDRTRSCLSPQRRLRRVDHTSSIPPSDTSGEPVIDIRNTVSARFGTSLGSRARPRAAGGSSGRPQRWRRIVSIDMPPAIASPFVEGRRSEYPRRRCTGLEAEHRDSRGGGPRSGTHEVLAGVLLVSTTRHKPPWL